MRLYNDFLRNRVELTVDDSELRVAGIDIGELAACIRKHRKYPVRESASVTLPINTTLRIGADGGITFKTTEVPEPRRIYVSEDKKVTVIIWNDGDKTIARCSEGDTPNVERGIWAATMRKLYGSRSHYKKLFGRILRPREA